MKKSELIDVLSKYDDDAELMIRLDGEDYYITNVVGTWDIDENMNQIDATNLAFIVGEI